MQHFGAPTRLLDWSSSIYVAAYFSATSNLEKDGAVYLAHVSTLKDRMSEVHPGCYEMDKSAEILERNFLANNAVKNIIFCDRGTKAERMIAQQGMFSVSRNLFTDHGKVLADLVPEQTETEVFRKLIIPASQKIHFIKRLRGMNITGSSLFPGLDGVGKFIKESVLIS